MSSKYLYGIIDSGQENERGISGLECAGLVYTIAHQNCGCVVSDYSGKEFSRLSKEEVVRCLLAHQLVVEHMMKEHTVLPVKFSTVLNNAEEVRRLLAQCHSQFVDALAWVQGKVEIEVAATWETKQILAEISTAPEIVCLRQAITERGQTTFQEQIQVGRMVKASMEKRRRYYREQIVNFLMSLAVDWQPNVLVSDEMVTNFAFLIEKTNQEVFDNCVRQLDDLFGNQINFRIIGPLPPYSFATVDITRLNREKVAEAKQLLHLGSTFLESDVRKAYRHLAAESHPDYKPGDEMTKARFVKLRQASELLSAYCRGDRQNDAKFLINIRRSTGDEVEHWPMAGVTNG